MRRRRAALRVLGIMSIALWSTGPLSISIRAAVTRSVSDMNWRSVVNGWGPAERDQSNGETAAGDGGALTIGGVSYVKGLGVHAYSEIRVDLFGGCTAFDAIVGVDDEVGANGSVVFAVYGDGMPLYSSGVVTGSSQGVPVSIPVNGIHELWLVVTDAGDGPYFDHADWADASLTCDGGPENQFAPPVSQPALVNPHGVRLADLNGDGRLDLVAANSGSSAASVWLGNGNTTFGARMDFATGPGPKSAAIGDLNGDGRLDLVTANQGGASVSVLLATATGDFGYGAAVDYPACSGTHEAAVGDFTSDGIPDLIVACWGGSVVSFLRGIGDGTFASLVNHPVGPAPHSVVTGDFNHDGLLDAAVANHDGASVSVLIGRGDGTFNPHVPYAVGNGPHSLRAGDLDGDGTLDLVVANDASNSVSVLRGTYAPDGAFTPAVHYPTGSVPKGVAIGDLDGDQRADLLTANTAGNYPVCCNPGGDTMSVLLNTSGSCGDESCAFSFAAAQTYTVGTTPFAVATGDLDNDGDLDVATANWHSDDVTILRNVATLGTHLSDLNWESMTNGWGPVERDRSNGELGASDGVTMTLNGAAFAKGLGAHSYSDVEYRLPGSCQTFHATVGVDDEVGSLGSVVFQVFVDGSLRFDSGVMTGTTASKQVSTPLGGALSLRLVVTDAGDGPAYDHADWAGARIVCTS